MKVPFLMRTGFKATIPLSLALLLAGGAFGLEPPTKQQLAQYRLDGTLARRIADAKAFGNDRANPGLLRDLPVRLERLRRNALGMTDSEIDAIRPVFPPDERPGLCSKGNNNVFVLLIDFPDYPAGNTAAAIDAKIFGGGDGGFPRESLRNYYRRSSYGLLEIQGSTLGWYRPAYSRADVSETDTGRENLIKEALAHFDREGHDFSRYDNDNDGVIDYFLVVWTGPPGEWASFWWGYYTGWDSRFILDGKQFANAAYSWQWESNPFPGTFDPRVTIHETGHALGLPDLYDYDDTVGPGGGVGGIDMMDSNRGDHNGFSKMLLDWLTPEVCAYGTRTGTFALRPTASFKDAVIFWPDYDAASPFSEFFMVQNRTRVENDTGLPADGLLIWHVDARLSPGGYFLYDNSYSAHKLVRMMEADGLEEIEAGEYADAGDYYVAGKRFSKNTTPSTDAYDGSRTNAYLDSITGSGSDMTCNISFAGVILKIGVSNVSLGTTNPAPGAYTYGIGADVQVRALPVQHCTLTGWSGNASGKANPVTIHLDRNKSVTAKFKLVSPPSDLAAVRQKNRSVTQTEYLVDLSWKANAANAALAITGYRVYRKAGSSWAHLADVPAAAQTYRHRAAPAVEQTYGVTSVCDDGTESDFATVAK
jgi:M6 family metalloprotease-like protein